MLLTTNQACELLATVGVRRESARRLLKAGFAGRGICTRSAVLYDDAAVRALMGWRTLEAGSLDPPCDRGVLVIRAGPGLDVTVQADHFARVGRPLLMSGLTRVIIREGIRRDGFYPVAITVSGFVAQVGEITRATLTQSGRTQLRIHRGGAWSDQLGQSRFDVRHGGPWTIWTTIPFELAAG